ncbi:MAG: hypothetical protein U0U67_00475 [Chitinophagales bacterium]
MRNPIIYLVTAIILIASCARPYHRMNMELVPFKDYKENDKLKYASRLGVLYNFKNFYFAKREQRKDFTLMAFTIYNKSEQLVNVKDLQFSCGASAPISYVPIQDLYNAIKQKAGLYWLYSVGVAVYPKPAPGKADGGLIKNEKLFVPLPFGVVFGAANFGIAYRANKKMRSDFELYDIANKVIQPGDSIKGILAFKGAANCGDIFISVKE